MTDAFFKEIESRMQRCIAATSSEFASIRTGRATPTLLDRLHVDAYGQSVPLKQVAGISVPDSRTLLITAWDKGLVAEIKKSIEKSDLGLTPNVDGAAVRLTIPQLNEERRKELAKIVKKKAEDGRVAVRNVRHKAHDDVKGQLKSGEITEDDSKRMQDALQKLTDKYVKEIDGLVVSKERDHGSVSDDFVLVSEVEVRHALRQRSLRMQVLAPYGSWLGCGTLRVLRLRVDEETTEMTVGYDRYELLPDTHERER